MTMKQPSSVSSSRAELIAAMCDWLAMRYGGGSEDGPTGQQHQPVPSQLPLSEHRLTGPRYSAAWTVCGRPRLLQPTRNGCWMLWSTTKRPSRPGRMNAGMDGRAALVHRSIFHGGPPTSEDWQRLDTHLDRLSRLLLEAARHGRDHWTEEQRRLYGHQPDESRPLAFYRMPESRPVR